MLKKAIETMIEAWNKDFPDKKIDLLFATYAWEAIRDRITDEIEY